MSLACCKVASLLLLFAGAVGSADEKKIPLSDVPKVVLDAVKAKYPSAELKEATKETDGDEVIYEIALNNAGKAVTVSLDAKGEIEEIETELAVSDLPAVVREAMAKKYPGSTIQKAEELVAFEDGKPEESEYELVLATADGKTIEVTVEVNVEIEEAAGEPKMALSDLPKAVLDAVKAKYPSGELKDATKETGEDGVIYEITLNNAGKAVTVSLDAKGEIEEIETELAEADLPAAVREAVAKKYPDSKIQKAEELVEFEDGKPETAYEVQVKNDEGKMIELKVEANGEIEDESDAE